MEVEKGNRKSFQRNSRNEAKQTNTKNIVKSEVKAREIRQSLRRPFVERILSKDDRKPLTDFSIGQKVHGRIISITE